LILKKNINLVVFILNTSNLKRFLINFKRNIKINDIDELKIIYKKFTEKEIIKEITNLCKKIVFNCSNLITNIKNCKEYDGNLLVKRSSISFTNMRRIITIRIYRNGFNRYYNWCCWYI
jgi:hypothetical protein